MSSRPRKERLATTRADLVLILVLGAVTIAMLLVSLALRIAALAPNRDVPIEADLLGERFALPLGPGGADVDAGIDTVVVEVDRLSTPVYLAALAHAVVPVLAGLIVVGCARLLTRNLLRGRPFCRANTRLLTTVSLTIALGWLLTMVLGVVTANAALRDIAGGGDALTVQFEVGLVPFGAALAVAALAYAFRSGERLADDVEGLV